MTLRHVLAAVLLVLAVGLVRAEDWPQWRGPNRTGVVAKSPALLDAWPKEGPKKVWEVPLAPGNGSPVVAAGKVYIATEDNTLVCLDAATGAAVWKAANPEGTGGAFSTPCVAGGRVYVTLNGCPCCYDAATGAQVWKGPSLGKDVNASPLIVGSAAVFSGQGALKAFDAATGKELWSQPKAGADNTVNASPALWSHGGKDYIIVNTTGSQVCVDAATGAVKWRAERGGGFQTPAMAGDWAVVGCAVNGDKIAGYKLSEEGGQKVWEVPFGSQESSPTIVGDAVYATSGEEMICLALDTGRVLWRAPLKVRVASAVVADGKLIMLIEDGRDIVYLRASPEKFTSLGRQVIDGHICTTPAIVDGMLYVRLKKSLACYDLRKP